MVRLPDLTRSQRSQARPRPPSAKAPARPLQNATSARRSAAPPRTRQAPAYEFARTISASSAAARSTSSLTTMCGNSPRAASSSSATFEPRLDRRRVVGAATLEATAQIGPVGWRDEDLDRLRHRRPHLAGTLQLDLEHDRRSAGVALLDLGAQRPVPVAAVGGVLEEAAGGDPAVELVAVEEVVVDALGLARPGRPRRRRRRQLELGDDFAEGADQRPLADPGGPGDYEDSRHDGRFLLQRRSPRLSAGAVGRRARSAAGPTGRRSSSRARPGTG